MIDCRGGGGTFPFAAGGGAAELPDIELRDEVSPEEPVIEERGGGGGLAAVTELRVLDGVSVLLAGEGERPRRLFPDAERVRVEAVVEVVVRVETLCGDLEEARARLRAGGERSTRVVAVGDPKREPSLF